MHFSISQKEIESPSVISQHSSALFYCQVERQVVNQLAAAYEQELLPKGCTLLLTVDEGMEDRRKEGGTAPSLRLELVGEDSKFQKLEIRPPLNPEEVSFAH